MNLEWIQNWCRSQCDGDWEHEFGITIKTVDNPGWYVTIDLSNTDLDGVPFEEIQYDLNKEVWFFCLVRGNTFVGGSGPCSLELILKTFREWAEKHKKAGRA